MRRQEINPVTGQPFVQGEPIRTKDGLRANFWAYHVKVGIVLVQTQPDSNTWQHSIRVDSIVKG